MAAFRRTRGGFTLVELLVVVVIIGVLVALVMPAVMSARRTAQRAKCVNYLREIVQATIAYENNKQKFPGAISSGPQNSTRTWVVEILPYIGRDDVFQTWRRGPGQVVQINQFACPNDTDALANTAALSYVANLNLFRDVRNQPPQSRISMSDVKAAGRTPMFSEKLGSGPWNTTNDISKLTFQWPATTANATIGSSKCVTSNHQGGSHIAFGDGSVAFVPDDTACNDYLGNPVTR
jgi:prepilin-type N-terminal cleavage/methylation domain-containing protein/prepilin-type processing-associated H-X9-DG protein